MFALSSRCDNLSMANAVKSRQKSEHPGHYVREWREYRGLTQEQLAERIGKTHGAVSHLENGKSRYTQRMLEAIGEALSCEPGDLLTRDPRVDNAVADLGAMLRKVSVAEQQRAVRILRELLTGDEPHSREIVRQEEVDSPVAINPGGSVRNRTLGGARKGQ
jgi:transcriptional regulator with XRE-family HTH domain